MVREFLLAPRDVIIRAVGCRCFSIVVGLFVCLDAKHLDTTTAAHLDGFSSVPEEKRIQA